MLEDAERPTSRSVRSAERRDRITAIAGRHITDHGFDSLSVNDLATAAGISVGGMYRYINTKTDLLVMVCQGIYDGVRDELGDIAAGPEPIADKLAIAVDRYLEICEGKRSQIAMMYREYRRLPDDAQQVYKQCEQAIADVFADLVRAGVRRGSFRIVDATVLGVDVVFLGHLPALKWWALRDSVVGDELRREQVALVMSRVLPS